VGQFSKSKKGFLATDGSASDSVGGRSWVGLNVNYMVAMASFILTWPQRAELVKLDNHI